MERVDALQVADRATMLRMGAPITGTIKAAPKGGGTFLIQLQAVTMPAEDPTAVTQDQSHAIIRPTGVAHQGAVLGGTLAEPLATANPLVLPAADADPRPAKVLAASELPLPAKGLQGTRPALPTTTVEEGTVARKGRAPASVADSAAVNWQAPPSDVLTVKCLPSISQPAQVSPVAQGVSRNTDRKSSSQPAVAAIPVVAGSFDQVPPAMVLRPASPPASTDTSFRDPGQQASDLGTAVVPSLGVGARASGPSQGERTVVKGEKALVRIGLRANENRVPVVTAAVAQLQTAPSATNSVKDVSPAVTGSTPGVNAAVVLAPPHLLSDQALPGLNAVAVESRSAHATSPHAETGIQLATTARADPEPAAGGLTTRTLEASPASLEIGVATGTHGWVRVRAELGKAGEVTTNLTASSSAAAESLRRDLPALATYLGQHTASPTVSLHAVGDAATGASVEGSGNGSAKSGNQAHTPTDPGGTRAGRSSREPSRGMLSPADVSGPLHRGAGIGGWLSVRV